MGRIMVNGENFSGSEVVANPTLAGTETNLTGLEVDGTKYAVSGGGGGGSGLTDTVLFTGTTRQTTINLSDSLLNYKYIQGQGYFTYNNLNYYLTCFMNVEGISTNDMITLFDNERAVRYKSDAAGEVLTLAETIGQFADGVIITKIIGIK